MITPVLLTTSVIILLLCISMLVKAGSGRHILTISRRSASDPETAWNALQAAWQENGLSFKPSQFRASDHEDTRFLVTSFKGMVDEITLKCLPEPAPRSVVFSVVHENGNDHPAGEGHFEHWSIHPDGAGSKIVVQTRFQKGLANTVATLHRLWRNAGMLATAKTERPQTSADVSDSDSSKTVGTRRATSRKTGSRRFRMSSELPAQYGREAAMSLFAFAYMLTQYSWQSAVVLALVILWHEYGHLLAYQLTGKTGNRLMLVPFFGGIAVAGSPLRSELEKAFCAIMGPAICAPVTIASFAIWYYTESEVVAFWAWKTLYFSSVLNLLNLLPIYPLDGGHTAEAFLRSFFPKSILVHLSGLSVVGLLALLGLGYTQMAVFMGIFCFLGLRSLRPHSPLPALSGPQAVAMALFYAVTVAAHGSVFYFISTY
jgi:Zn-dependent protease